MSRGRKVFDDLRDSARKHVEIQRQIEAMQKQFDGRPLVLSLGDSASIAASPEYSFNPENYKAANMKKGGKVKSASKRADGIAIRGKTRA